MHTPIKHRALKLMLFISIFQEKSEKYKSRYSKVLLVFEEVTVKDGDRFPLSILGLYFGIWRLSRSSQILVLMKIFRGK